MRPYHGHNITEATLSKRLEAKDEDPRPLPRKEGNKEGSIPVCIGNNIIHLLCIKKFRNESQWSESE